MANVRRPWLREGVIAKERTRAERGRCCYACVRNLDGRSYGVWKEEAT